jgi:predicted NUDIX family phosphoesterase
MSLAQDILVLPKECIKAYHRFTPWENLQPLLYALESQSFWLSRQQAEEAKDLVQPIPCALIRNHKQRYCVLRRIHVGRSDLQSRIALTIGGHIDRTPDQESAVALLLATLYRELSEELGLTTVSQIQPVGLVIDTSSRNSSQHIAFVYEVVADQEVRTLAREEFSRRSKLNRKFLNPSELLRLQKEFDPWSLILFDNYLAPTYGLNLVRQLTLPWVLAD